MKNSSALLIGGTIVVVVALLVWARGVSEPKANVARVWQDTDIACLIFGHQNLAMHIHPHLSIIVDGNTESVPTNIGVDDSCMSEVHTHDASGQLHIESITHGKEFTLLDYFKVQGGSIEREGFSYEVFVDGQLVDPATYVLEDLDRIEVQYTSN